MEAYKTTEPDEARLAEIAYHQRQNKIVLLAAVPSIILAAAFYSYLSKYFQSFLFVLWLVNIITAVIIIDHSTNIQKNIVYKRVSAGIGLGLFATNLLTGLWDPDIYYFVLPWIFLYPLTAIMFYGRKLGFITGTAFSILALFFFLVNDLPPWNAPNIKMFQFNAVAVLLTILMISIIYEKTRMKVQDDLAISENQYKLAEMRQRETNAELQQEIERRKQSEKALAESELHYRALFEESSVALWEEDWSKVKLYLDGLPQEALSDLPAYFKDNPQAIEKCLPFMRVKAVNRATLKLYHADSQSTLLRNLSHIVAPDTSGFVVEQVLSLYLTGMYTAELTGMTLDGKKLHLLVSSTIPAGYENSWEKIFSSVYDATERVAIEEAKKQVDRQIQNSRQIQAIGTLAGGIAHQFNNALAIIYGSLDLLEMNLHKDIENRRFLTSLKTSADRMNRLTDQLLAYAEGGKYQPQNFSVNDLVKNIIGSKTMVRDSTIQVLTELDSDAHTTGDITQIKMVVEAVLSNAFEALHAGGCVKITTGHKLIAEPLTNTEQLTKPGDYTFICIEDNGTGMKEETLKRVFEPFFTTKIYGRGLGMAAAFGIVRNHDGMIKVDSEPDKGTKVVVYLPSSDSRENRMQQFSL